MKLLSLLPLLAAVGCIAPREPFDRQIARIHSEETDERDDYFEAFTESPPELIPLLRRRMEEGHVYGYPIVAILYCRGEGDAVPLELKIAHYAKFQWPARYAVANTILEIYVWNELERDILRAGRPALRLLAHALVNEAPDEERAARVARLMVRLAAPLGRAGAEEFARLLEARAPGGTVAAAALLHLGCQDAVLASTKPEDYVAAARTWWAAAQGRTEDEWIAEGAARAVERMSDPAEAPLWTSYLSLLFGRDLADKAATLKAWQDLKSLPPEQWVPDLSKDPAELAHSLRSAGRARAYQINRRLERLLGIRLDDGFALHRLDDYPGARALWQAEPSLAVRWQRYLESALLHMTLLVVGRHPTTGAGGLLGFREQYFHGTEDETGGWRSPADEYQIYLQSRALGTRLIYSEYLSDGTASRGSTNQFPLDNNSAIITFNPSLRTCAIVFLEDVPSRAPPIPPALAAAYLAKNLVRLLNTPQMPQAARALAYLGATVAADAIADRAKTVPDRADLGVLAAALVLLDDPRGLDLGVPPALAPHEVEMVRSFSKNERIRGLKL